MAKASFFNNGGNKKAPDDSLLHKEHNETAQEQDFFKKAVYIILILFGVMLFTFAVTFFASVRGGEKTLIPNVVGEQVTDALITLQERELYPKVLVKFTDDPKEKNTIIAQSPKPGTSVKAGRRVILTISKGAVVENVGNYVGSELDEVRANLQTLFATYKPLLQIAEVIYQHSDEPVGTILAQEPAPGTEVTELTDLTFIVSRGMDEGMYKVENFNGMGYDEVVQILSEQNIPFIFDIDSGAPAQREAVVFKQNPPIGDYVELGVPIELTINGLSKVPRGMVFGLFEYQLPVYMIPVTVQLERQVEGQEPEIIFTTKYPGGRISVPYMEEEGTTLVLYVSYKEKTRILLDSQE
ncbi:MAG: PASTA domain-containing protein [Spirochaetales bacterium]|nr:PASTA domain-containing protein [Spirochaetales bacterium]